MTIREYLASIGATQAELQAKVVARMEQAMMVDADLQQFKPDTVLEMLYKTIDELKLRESSLSAKLSDAKTCTYHLDHALKIAQAERDDLKAQTAGLKDMKISSPETKDAVMAFTATLNATKEIFGTEAMTSDVIVAAINAGSYMAWRSIMGPKDTPEPVKTTWRR